MQIKMLIVLWGVLFLAKTGWAEEYNLHLPVKPFPNKEAFEERAKAYPETAKLIHVNDKKLNEKAREFVTRVTRVYRELYPDIMANKEEPFIYVYDSVSETPKSLRHILPTGEKLAALVVSNHFLQVTSDEELLGVIAHELGHTFFESSNLPFFYQAYRVQGNSYVEVPEKIKSRLQDWLRLSQVAGEYTDAALGGLLFQESLLYTDLNQLVHNLVKITPKRKLACFRDVMQKYMNILNANFSYWDWDMVISQNSSAELAKQTQEIKHGLVQCSEAVGYKGEVLRKRMYPSGIFEVESQKYFSFHLQRSFEWKDQNEFAVLFEVSEVFHREMAKIQEELDFKSLRTFTYEDVADVKAFQVLHKLRIDPMIYAKSIMQFKSEGRSIFDRCVATVAAGQEPPFGNLGDPHHGLCWRYYHFYHLSQGKPIWPAWP